MKRKMIEAVPPKPKKSRKSKDVITTQIIGDTMVLNVWSKNSPLKSPWLEYRYCIRETGEYEILENGIWSVKRWMEKSGGYYYYTPKGREKLPVFDREEDKTLAENWVRSMKTDGGYSLRRDLSGRIDSMETEYRWKYAEQKEDRRQARIEDRMMKIAMPPADLAEWTYERIGSPDYAFWDKEKERWGLTCCGKYRKRLGKGKVKHLDIVVCPSCGKKLTAMKRKTDIGRAETVLVFQNSPIGGVMRFFGIEFLWIGKERKTGIYENVRILLAPEFKNHPVYWRNWEKWDNLHNGQKRRDYNNSAWLYADDVEAAVKETKWQQWGKTLSGMQGRKAYYDKWMTFEKPMNALEYLAKGRFYRLLEEATPHCGLNDEGKSIEEVFRIKDRQKINRIRDRNGGIRMLYWMQWADRCHKKIADSFLSWTEKEKILPDEGRWLFLKLSPEAAMHYIERQRRESYKGASAKTVISQYEDYMRMCQRLDKDLADEMVIKPRELKRRHDEAVKEIEFREAELDAKKYSDRFPEAEKVLTEIRKNLEYKGKDYRIAVPKRIIDIVAEGRVLHHCAGATDRYFDRIASHETYIVFLRKNTEPDTPYYTIEVEPGGTIRQHRGMNDEEPDIEIIKPFLREWQKEIKKRMKAKDRERAKISAIKREENIKDLKAKNNKRVLQGLMEDFMEAM